jgi:hypothetical protein
VEYIVPIGPPTNIGIRVATFLAITPPTDFSISSESKKSYLFNLVPSTVSVSKEDSTCLPIGLLPPRVS